ncbi:hypothetical protein [Shewanella sp. UCD-KL12]|uniref:hypothetical protein n=1 Tax=Shewanella sp. UCD-KL12 TaxID=1917163 RepID=UPI000970A246|nr:hypothetical protein [Shewanella sp. UCD-KL12]
MSSPIGGFYLNAQYREKAARVELATKPELTVRTCIELDNATMIDDTRCGRAGFECLLNNDRVSVCFIAELISSEVVKFTYNVSISHTNSEIAQPMQQVLNLTAGEQLSVLVAGSERVKLTASFNYGKSMT